MYEICVFFNNISQSLTDVVGPMCVLFAPVVAIERAVKKTLEAQKADALALEFYLASYKIDNFFLDLPSDINAINDNEASISASN